MPPDIPSLRLHNQQILRPHFRSPGELVAHMGAVQAQEYWAGKWGVGLRLRGGTDAGVERAIAKSEIVRTWPMRGTLHFVAPADVRWMLRLLTPRVVRGFAARYRQLELDSRVFGHARKIIVNALEGGKSVTRLELGRLLRANGIETKENRGGHIFGQLAQEGTIIFGPHIGKQPAFVLLEEWVPPARMLEGEEAIAELTSRYFASHGPATIQDFCWWSGLTLREARLGIEGGGLVEEAGHWMAPPRRARMSDSPTAWMLPPFDEYAVAYRDRSAIVPNDEAKSATGGGIFAAIVVVDGQVVGSWKRALGNDGVTVTVESFQDWDATTLEAVQRCAQQYATFLGVPLAGFSSSSGSFSAGR